MLGRVGPDHLTLEEVARFDNVPVQVGGTLYWDVLALYRSVLEGLKAAGPLDSIGVDSWGVDFGLIDADGALVGNPVHYRDSRTDGVMARVFAECLPAEELYAATGIQFLPFNTAFQLVAAAGTAQLRAADKLLLMPDLLAYWLTGEAGAELTNASTTQLLDARTKEWSLDVAGRLGVGAGLLPRLRRPGDRIGMARELGVPVTAVASHDTASAVVGVPARDERFAYISCGTWSLVGVELDEPVLTEASRQANFTNEVGVDGTVRYLRNVMGLWPLQECLRAWGSPSLEPLLREAVGVQPMRSVVDPDDPVFLPPGDMPGRIAESCRKRGQPVPETRPEFVRCIVDSLALGHRAALEDAERLSGRAVDVVHIVGGGALNELLCQLTADVCGLPVEAGPVEATALGNVLVQARALGAVSGGLPSLRSLLRATQPIRRYAAKGRSHYERLVR
jgi:rhamnulokinase